MAAKKQQARRSFGNVMSSMELAVSGAKFYESDLPAQAGTAATELAKLIAAAKAANAAQEKAKKELAAATKKINDAVESGSVLRAKIVRFAEATFGPRADELLEFRPATEGKATRTPGK